MAARWVLMGKADEYQGALESIHLVTHQGLWKSPMSNHAKEKFYKTVVALVDYRPIQERPTFAAVPLLSLTCVLRIYPMTCRVTMPPCGCYSLTSRSVQKPALHPRISTTRVPGHYCSRKDSQMYTELVGGLIGTGETRVR